MTVQHSFDALKEAAVWPGTDPRTRVVFASPPSCSASRQWPAANQSGGNGEPFDSPRFMAHLPAYLIRSLGPVRWAGEERWRSLTVRRGRHCTGQVAIAAQRGQV